MAKTNPLSITECRGNLTKRSQILPDSVGVSILKMRLCREFAAFHDRSLGDARYANLASEASLGMTEEEGDSPTLTDYISL
jgi:hypothetical protein